jgi:hypothetical protein
MFTLPLHKGGCNEDVFVWRCFIFFWFYASAKYFFPFFFKPGKLEYPISYLVMLLPFPQQKYKYGLSFLAPEVEVPLVLGKTKWENSDLLSMTHTLEQGIICMSKAMETSVPGFGYQNSNVPLTDDQSFASKSLH